MQGGVNWGTKWVSSSCEVCKTRYNAGFPVLPPLRLNTPTPHFSTSVLPLQLCSLFFVLPWDSSKEATEMDVELKWSMEEEVTCMSDPTGITAFSYTYAKYIWTYKHKAFSSFLYGTGCKERNQLPLDIGDPGALKEKDRRRKSMCILTFPIACRYEFQSKNKNRKRLDL